MEFIGEFDFLKSGVKFTSDKSFVDRIWILDDEIRERRRAVDSWMETHANQRRRILDEQLRVGKMAWLSTDGITLPWDKHRQTKRFRQKWYGPFEILEKTSPVSFKLNLAICSLCGRRALFLCVNFSFLCE